MLSASTIPGSAMFLAAYVTMLVSASSPAERRGALRATADLNTLQGELQNAIGEALGCGGHISQAQLSSIKKVLAPTWRSLPKTAAGRIDQQSLRYLVHRYFSGQFSFRVRGFEPTKPAQLSSESNTDIISLMVPQYSESLLQERGFGLHHAVQVVATIEELIFDSESALLEKAYQSRSRLSAEPLSAYGLQQVLTDYMLHWLMSGDQRAINELLRNKALLESSVPHWEQIVGLAAGQVKALDFSRQQRPQALAGRSTRSALSSTYSFEDAHQAVGHVTRSFHSFWNSECASMKEVLVAMDRRRTGRVPLSKFYSDGLNNEWRFGESEAYLRELGALDETSSWRGKQVIIANYMQASSNCIVSTPHYMVCCMNECDGLLGEIEVAVGRPTASPQELLRIVSNVTSQTTLDHDKPHHIEGSLVAQLEQIAIVSNGSIPLHGRLFAQWLHYIFPHECAFPHKSGTAISATPLEFGEKSFASHEDMRASAANVSNTSMGREDPHWMSQWSLEEELMAGPIGELQAPWEPDCLVFSGVAAIVFLSIAGIVGIRKQGADSPLLPTHAKAHFG